jgi:hypothetical protein
MSNITRALIAEILARASERSVESYPITDHLTITLKVTETGGHELTRVVDGRPLCVETYGSRVDALSEISRCLSGLRWSVERVVSTIKSNPHAPLEEIAAMSGWALVDVLHLLGTIRAHEGQEGYDEARVELRRIQEEDDEIDPSF